MKRTLSRTLFLVITVVLCLICFISCSKDKKQSLTLFAMNTVVNIDYYWKDDSLDEPIVNLIKDIENKFSVTKESSEIASLNEEKQGVLSKEVLYVLQRAIELCKETNGALNPTIYPIIKAWGFTTDNYRVPSQEEIDSLLQKVGIEKIHINGDFVTLEDGTLLDFGAIVKGYCGDEIINFLKSKGISKALVNLGGNVQVLGTKEDGKSWKIAIRDPYSESYLAVIDCSDMAVVTSGGYERFFSDEEGNIYIHIMNPKTGYPANTSIISSSIITESGFYADSLSTALFVMGPEQAIEFWKQKQDFDFILYLEDGRILVSKGLKGKITSQNKIEFVE
ncbi:MAG: FAD:protein FMN transferase [Sphaerochaetaceae bacterium]|nr:FAD:protein FMN transferase [Sphaerochaetaceae bacterium]